MALAPKTTLAVYGTLLASYHFPKSTTWTFTPRRYKVSSLTAPGTLIVLEVADLTADNSTHAYKHNDRGPGYLTRNITIFIQYLSRAKKVAASVRISSELPCTTLPTYKAPDVQPPRN